MAKAKTTNLGKVVKIEGGIATTDKKQRSVAVCNVGDVLVLDNKTRKVTVKEAKVKEVVADTVADDAVVVEEDAEAQ